MPEFDWPWQHSFPPFFTLQPNKQTRQKQLIVWGDLVLNYYKFNKQFCIEIKEAAMSPLFFNKDINRHLNSDGVNSVLEYLSSIKNAEAVDKNKTRWHIYWHTLNDWADLIYSWAERSGVIGTVCTLYEIINTEDEEFSQINKDVLLKALQILQRNNKAEIIMFDDNNGVKFF